MGSNPQGADVIFENLRALGKLCRALRKQFNKSTRDTAQSIGVDPNTYLRVEHGDARNAVTVGLVCRFYDLDAGGLVTGRWTR